MIDLCDIEFAHSFVRELPADSLATNIPRAVREACYTRVMPTPVAAPRLLAWSDELGATLGIARPPTVSPAVEALAGNRVPTSFQPYAARYGGHQFGHWAGQLGDGRAIVLGEMQGRDGKRYDLQLKGAGPTPYSRRADGRAVLRSSVREFLCSEAMHHLGIPTTRALSLVGSGDSVIRDMFYDGHPQAEPGAIVCRVAPSFVRFGNFEIHAAQDESASLKRLADYVLRHHYPELGAPSPAVYALWFEEIARRTAVTVAHWMRVGFVHGVMNTDNMSILGLTIDYGPYGWLEGYEPEWTPNTTDATGRRYCYGNQPAIAYWNLQRLAMAIAPLLDEPTALRSGLTTFEEEFATHSQRMLADKLGLGALQTDDEAWIAELFELLQSVETDMTLFFRGLMSQPIDTDAVSDATPPAWLQRAFYDEHAIAPPLSRRWAAWLRRYIDRIRGDAQTPQARQRQMKAANPKYVVRNYLAQQAIDALALGDAAPLERLLDVLRHPYDEQPAHDDLAARRPEWARHRAGCSALSCSS